ncbi:hypothetical protein HK104_003958 [Borealophlyctis nickersoniae]|nr:hypothetical protein HK104_003958 [Borealophlyctis nickersoniae]
MAFMYMPVPATEHLQLAAHQRRKKALIFRVAVLGVLLALLVLTSRRPTFPSRKLSDVCVQPPPLAPRAGEDITRKNYEELFKGKGSRHDEFRNASAKRLAEACTIKTESYDFLKDVPPLPDDEPEPAREGFLKFHKFLEDRFPLLHKHCKKEVINRYSLLYTWEGSDASLEPLLLMSHIDTVPVPNATLDQWKHPPFAGYVDEEYIWGRGAVDTKNTLLAIVEAVEALLNVGFKPRRTVLMAFGSDEEISGHQGAKKIAQSLLDRGLKDKVALAVDEGSQIVEAEGVTLAMVSIQEKGYVDVSITVETPGGHSSIPPPHTGIGILAQIITHIEAITYTPELGDENPFLDTLRCTAKYSTEMDPWLKKAIEHIDVFRPAVVKLLSTDPRKRYMMQTSQAVDKVEGGVKVNALPEHASTTINHRIAIHEHVSTVEEHLLHRTLPFAEHHNLSLTTIAFDGHNKTYNDDAPRWGTVKIQTVDVLEPAPRSPSAGKEWDVLGGTIKRVFGDESGQDEGESDVVVTPLLMPANTDTRHFWDLTRNIYRFGTTREKHTFGLHTVNERIAIDAHVDSMAFYHEFIRNVDEM